MKEIMKARKKDAPVKPPAQLEPRDGDFDLPPALYLACKVFARLKTKPSTDKFPGTLLLRRYGAGDVICWQGDPGWTAFAILSSEDLAAMRKERDRLVAELPAKVQKATAAGKAEDAARDQDLLAALQRAKLPDPPQGAGPAATVYLDPSRGAVPKPRGWLSRLFGRGKEAAKRPAFIPVDAPTTVAYGTRKAALAEGSLFGQWSCIYGTPRSATIVAERHCYVLEMLRNVLDSILRDAQFQEDTDREYVQSVLQNHLAGLPLFRDLTPEQLAEVRAQVRLKRLAEGQVVCRKGDPSDCIYIVRRGVVKVLLDDAGGTETVLTYHARGDFFGEMGVILNQPRSATCVAYVHPRPPGEGEDAQGDRWRKQEFIELVEVPAEVVWKVYRENASVRRQVDAEIAARRARSEKREAPGGWEGAAPQQSERFQQLGLIQGQKLMLIDLDRCTRCDECVEACVAQHDDGRARLFLDGPRFGKYLVPTTCRACRDPVCLIGCPVGSIRRGDNLQIVIEDWCIGCQLCAKGCPYGSIQMHDLGLIHEESLGWTVLPRQQVRGDAWTRPGFDDRAWEPARTPFWWDRDRADFDDPPTLCFRRDFHLDAGTRSGYKLVIESAAKEIAVEGSGRQAKLTSFLPVWLNGNRVPLDRWKLDRDQYVCEVAGDDPLLRPGRNAVAIEATAMPGRRAVLLQLALDEVLPSGAVIPLRAVVCDQCSELPGRVPACVHACPHDAAMRVDAWTGFPS
jgi:CRP-like cAMP-binding protein/Fe-S-cluster-containing hydrogenase component 2